MHDFDGTGGVHGDVVGDAAEEDAFEPADAAGADEDAVGAAAAPVAGFLDEPVLGVAEVDDGGDRNAGASSADDACGVGRELLGP